MSDAVTAMNRLDEQAAELDHLSKQLAEVERQLEPAEAAYEAFMAAYEGGLWQQHREGDKFPPEKLRERMGRQAMDPEMLGRYVGLTSARRRLKDRISAVKSGVDAQRTILSALKEEMAASGGGLRRAA